MKIVVVLFVLTANMMFAHADPFFPIPVNPDQEMTPGDFCSEDDRDFDGYRYPEKMIYCHRNVSKGDKNSIYKRYKVDIKCKHRYTIDHMVPLALGGNNSHENLWPEHMLVKETRQELEQEMYNAVSSGQMTSEEAVRIITEEKLKLQLDLSHVEGCG